MGKRDVSWCPFVLVEAGCSEGAWRRLDSHVQSLGSGQGLQRREAHNMLAPFPRQSREEVGQDAGQREAGRGWLSLGGLWGGGRGPPLEGSCAGPGAGPGSPSWACSLEPVGEPHPRLGGASSPLPGSCCCSCCCCDEDPARPMASSASSPAGGPSKPCEAPKEEGPGRRKEASGVSRRAQLLSPAHQGGGHLGAAPQCNAATAPRMDQ